MINLNDEKFNGRENAPKVFNNGEAGEVIVTFRVEKKKIEDNPNSPDWKLYWIHPESEAEINSGYYYLNPNHPSYETQLSVNGRIMKDILRSIYGEDIQLPSADNYKLLLDNCMELIAAKTGEAVKIGVTYGTIRRPSKKGYLQLKNTFPFITGKLDENIEFNWDYDLQHRPKSDSEKIGDVPADVKKTESEEAPW